MGVKQTSIDAYQEQALSGRSRTQRERILKFLEDHQLPRNRREISIMTGISINAVCGRVNDMLYEGQLHVAYIDQDPVTRKKVEYVEPKPKDPVQGRLFR